MDKQGVAHCRSILVLRWIARIWSLGLLVLWGTFFIEHLQWFADPRQLPPFWVFLLMELHLMMLIGLIVGWRWELPGGLLVVVSATLFFAFAAGSNFLPFTAMTATPGILWILCGWSGQWQPKTPNWTPSPS